jgi:hypothetical protein
VLLLTGCGRIAFDSRPDASPDGTAPPGPDSFAAQCNAMRVTIINDGVSLDDTTAMMATTTIMQSCGTNPAVTMVNQGDAGVLDPTTHEPLLLSTELGVLGGGNIPQLALRYLGQADTPLVVGGPGGFVNIDVRATGVRVVDLGPITAVHDYAIIQVIGDSNTSTRYLSLFAPGGPGTIAAGVWFSTTFAPLLATDRNRWYVIEWSDTDGTSGVSPGDKYFVTGSGE